MKDRQIGLSELVDWLIGISPGQATAMGDAQSLNPNDSDSGRLQPADINLQAVFQCISSATTADLEQMCGLILANFESSSSHPIRLRAFFQNLASVLLQRSQHWATETGQQDDWTQEGLSVELMEQLYEQLQGVDAVAGAHALQCLAAQGDQDSIDLLASILNENPPEDWPLVGIALSPLWNSSQRVLERFYAAASQALFHPASISVLMDLANHSFRKDLNSVHLYSSDNQRLIELLRQLTSRLERLTESPESYGGDVTEIQRRLSESVALTVSVCDALGLLGDPVACPVLAESMKLAHRRIQTEAAAALVRLGDPRGQERLIELAADPAARRRAVSYAEELALEEQIPEEYRSPPALAESELVGWLATPEQFGVAPQSIELIDARTLYWPGYDEPRDCYLFRYYYQLPQGGYHNIGIAGPLTLTFPYDLNNLAVEDVYSAFAGWHAEHDEIFEVPIRDFNPAQRREAQRLQSQLEQQDCTVISLIALAFLFGDCAIITEIESNGKRYIAVTDGEMLIRHPSSSSAVADSSELVLSVYRGRKLLRAFNPQ
jgi:hypothetical protein